MVFHEPMQEVAIQNGEIDVFPFRSVTVPLNKRLSGRRPGLVV